MEITESQKLLLQALKGLDIDELVVGLRMSLCDYHCRTLAVGLILPLEDNCKGHQHDVSAEQESIDMAEGFLRSVINGREH